MTQADAAWRRRRNRGLVAGVAAAAVAAVLAVTAAGRGQDRAASDGPEAVERAGVPVWYDAKGLHRGDVVERTPVDIVVPEQAVSEDRVIPQRGALALVRSGALYSDPATGDVWFHPWGGDPRIVGHNSEAGPGGNPNGDTAVWFEGSDAPNSAPGKLVVYDTAAGREISRTRQAHGATEHAGGDHYPPGNGFRHVSARRVVWISGPAMYSHDVRTRRTSVVKTLKNRYLVDVHDLVKLLGERNPWVPVLKVPGRAEQRYPDLETHARLSPSGNYLLAVEAPTTGRHGAVIVNTRTGKLWRVPKPDYPWIAWSYGDIAMVDTDDQLLACDAARRTCERLRAKRPFLMPTN
jgi:hypothetical protein